MTTEYQFLDYLPDRVESCLQGVANALGANNPLVRQTLSSLEAPSAIAVVRSIFPDVALSIAEISAPDPRVPVRSVPLVLWTYQGYTASPALPPPPQNVVERIAALARSPYNLQRWSDLAADVVGLETSINDALAVGLYPPRSDPDSALTPWDWRFRVQVASMLAASRLAQDLGGDPVALLSDIVDGPIDWTTSAAIVALLDVALRLPNRGREVPAFLLNLLKRAPSPIWLSNGAYPAAVACRRIPALPEGVYARLDQIIDTFA